MNTTAYTKSGTKAASPAKLDIKIFGLKVKNHALLKQAYLSYLAANRQNAAVTKTRGLVRGGGRKPWRQKGTGNARVGSRRNPIWRGGGVVFGPTGEENFKIKLHKPAKNLALKQALSLAAEASKIYVIEDFKVTSAKTKDANKLLNKIGAKGIVYVVLDQISEDIKRACANLPNLYLRTSSGLNSYDVLSADRIIFSKTALANLTERLGVSK